MPILKIKTGIKIFALGPAQNLCDMCIIHFMTFLKQKQTLHKEFSLCRSFQITSKRNNLYK